MFMPRPRLQPNMYGPEPMQMEMFYLSLSAFGSSYIAYYLGEYVTHILSSSIYNFSPGEQSRRRFV